MSGAELITRRRRWSPTQKAALLEEIEDEGGKVAVVARRHGISESLLYNWRSALCWRCSSVQCSTRGRPAPGPPPDARIPTTDVTSAAITTSAAATAAFCRW